MERSPYVITAIMDAGPHLTTIEIYGFGRRLG